jgi:colanic acid biosynthesis glycosyl transferase WcaI
VLAAHGVLQDRKPLTNLLNNLNVFCMRRSERVVVLGRCMAKLVNWKGIDPDRIARISVWSDHEEIGHIPREDNPFRREWNIGDRFLVMYAGNIGLVHDVDTMCTAAEKLSAHLQFAFAFAGEGKRKQEIESRFAGGQARVTIAPYQPREKLDAVLTAADLHLISLREGYEGIVVPSKLYGIMAAGRPAVFIGPKQSEVAMVLTEEDCGRVVRPGDVIGLVNAITDLADNPERCRVMGENGRTALKQKYDRAHACAAWLQLLEQVARPMVQPSTST